MNIILTYKNSSDRKVAYVTCECGRNYVVDAYQMKSRNTKGCSCGGAKDYRSQRLDRKIALEYYTQKLREYWRNNARNSNS